MKLRDLTEVVLKISGIYHLAKFFSDFVRIVDNLTRFDPDSLLFELHQTSYDFSGLIIAAVLLPLAQKISALIISENSNIEINLLRNSTKSDVVRFSLILICGVKALPLFADTLYESVYYIFHFKTMSIVDPLKQLVPFISFITPVLFSNRLSTMIVSAE
ncbi:MAG: hypothetical protein KAH48_06315 [Chlorobi bacterium]|nr:hypothetical protein [Chlorobiota bacterium]